jgi:16S rRNA (adenine1518-N6/adenine1519-N6)-dimethyltransferase
VSVVALQPSLRRLRDFRVRPNRDLGQNFLVDSNILGVIARAAALEGDDVVLEIGGGLGVLSEYLADRAAHVHVVEIDERLRDALEDALGSRANVSVHWGDAMRMPLDELQPPPRVLVANLPYGIAASVLLRTVQELRSVERWVAMVQREVGERLAARAGSAAYGAPSVLAQLECDVRVVRAIARTVFHPVPNVDSVLVAMRRVPGASAPAPLRELVAGAFAHRRKTLARSLALSSALPGVAREQAREALEAIGQPPDARAERLSAGDFRELARALRICGRRARSRPRRSTLGYSSATCARTTAVTSSSR